LKLKLSKRKGFKMKTEIRFCQDIGMFAQDRSREYSCLHRTAFCEKTCYNGKLEKLYSSTIPGKDSRNDLYWNELNGTVLKNALKNRKLFTGRFRFCTRGEAFRDASDIPKIREILLSNPEVLFWIPTRAWRNFSLRYLIQDEIMPLRNARVQASIDPSNDELEIELLKADGWSTMFYGDDTATDKGFKCPKTWNKAKGHCAVCEKGCFSEKRTDVHLKQH